MDKPMFRPIYTQPITPGVKNTRDVKHTGASGFAQHLQNAVSSKSEKLTFSKHAQLRMNQRNISISQDQLRLMEEKVQEAKKKGVNDSLVLLKNAALIVSAKNNTVITAMDREEAASQIFTNINGTILMDN
ncbi:TIGR02530 family flagellar biosynthesis protein [Peribacillus tepidiphilus]|jgi:flagellar operon protein|uniref:TIGR02530 family flagellar biosynthesis protein n=1 Tax=Peribacillus tepidiphilus TaxID=2652445 RepID=UPI0035B54640